MIDSGQAVLEAMLADALAQGGVVGSANVAATYHAVLSPATYNEATGDVTPPAHTDYAVTGILTGYDAREVLPDVILQTDQRFLIQRSLLPLRPKAPDTVTVEGQEWAVVRYQQDANGLMWMIQLRLPGEVL